MKKIIFIIIIIAILVFAFMYKGNNKSQNDNNAITSEQVNQDQDAKDIETNIPLQKKQWTRY